MNHEKTLQLAVIGMGIMGSSHALEIASLQNARLAAVCDILPERADRAALPHGVPAFYDARQLLDFPGLDGVIIATPHYDHTPLSIAFLERGLHVLVEKPIAVHVQDAHLMISAFEQARDRFPGLVFSTMFMMRTYGYWLKIKEMIDSGELGRLVRATWIITDWFRTQSYYDNGDWRATWRGEGGGVLLNQCPHNLDLYQWFFGLPQRVTGLAAIGKYHNIEVEDEVTAFFEHENGMVGHFITSTGESPGSNRLEIAGENGKLIFEAGKLTFYRNQGSMLQAIRTYTSSFQKVETDLIEVPYEHHGESGHRLLLQNFVKAILSGETLIAPAVEGLNSLMLGNAIMLSSWTGRSVNLPFDPQDYADRLQKLIAASRFQKTIQEREINDFNKSFSQ